MFQDEDEISCRWGRSDDQATAVRVCNGGNAEDMGETCGCGAAFDVSSSDSDAELKLLGAPLVLGVVGAAEADWGILPIYHD